MSMTPLQKARLALRVLTGKTTTRERYLLQWNHAQTDSWVTVDRVDLRTAEEAAKLAVNGHKTPIPWGCKWRVVKETTTREVVG